MGKRKAMKITSLFRSGKKKSRAGPEVKENPVTRLLNRRKKKRQLANVLKQKTQNQKLNKTCPKPQLNHTIVISDSEDEEGDDGGKDVTVLPIVTGATAALPTPPPDKTLCTTASTIDLSGSPPPVNPLLQDSRLQDVAAGPSSPLMFFESRPPNNGKDTKPTYEEVALPGALTLNGLLNCTVGSQNDSIMDRPASTPLEENKDNPFEYSAISDAELSIVPDESSTLQNMGDFITLDETLCAGTLGEDEEASSSRKRKAEEGGVDGEEEKKKKRRNSKVPKQVDDREDGEIIELEEEDERDRDKNDDSVVFVSEEFLTPKRVKMMNKRLNMVQLLKEKAEKMRQKAKEPGRKPGLGPVRVQLELKPTANPRGKKKRMVIIDGSNVAYSHKENGQFSVHGLELCLQHFLSRGFEARAVVPQFRMKRTQTDDHVKMLQLESKKLLIKTPAKDLAGKFAASYDDRFILNIAKEFDAAVVSNDHYRDLLPESEDFAFIIKNRVIGYTWVMDKIFIPDDPYGKIGPNLNDILYKDDEDY